MPDTAPAAPRTAVVTSDDAAFRDLSGVFGEVGLEVVQVAPDGHGAWALPEDCGGVLLDRDVVPDPDGLERALGENGIERERPVILLVRAPLSREESMAWLEAGAWDVSRMPVERGVFPLRLRNLMRAGAAAAVPAARDETRVRYGWSTLRRVAEESLSLADRYGRPLACVAVALEWPGHSGGWARSVVERLGDATLEIVRRSDVIGISDEGALLVLLPDTPQPGAGIFLRKLVLHLEQRLREWGILGRLRTATAYSSDVDSADDLLRAAAQAVH